MKTIFIEEDIVKGKRLGRHVEHDPLSKAWGIRAEADAIIHSVSHRLYNGPLNQLNTSSCTGNATAGLLNTQGSHKPKSRFLREKDALDIYSLGTQLDEFPGQYPPDDNGSSGLAVAKAAQQMGLITEYRHAFSAQDGLSALMLKSIITGVNWYPEFDRPDPYGVVKLGTTSQPRGGHEFLINGYNAKNHMIRAINSWGPSYGVGGAFFFSLKDWEALLEQDGDCTVLIV